MIWYSLFRLMPIPENVLMGFLGDSPLFRIYGFWAVFALLSLLVGILFLRIKEPLSGLVTISFRLYLVLAVAAIILPFAGSYLEFEMRDTTAEMAIMLLLAAGVVLTLSLINRSRNPRYIWLASIACAGAICHYLAWFLLMWIVAAS